MGAIRWTEDGSERSAQWHSENSTPPPARIVVVDDTTTANAAYRLARKGTGLLWRGDYHNARQLLRAMDRRLQRDAAKRTTAADFATHRSQRAERSRVLGRLIILLEADHSLRLRRAPDVRSACLSAYGEPTGPRCIALTELLGVIGAHQWHTKGVVVPALGDRVHPGYGVFSPARGEYIDLVATTPLPVEGPSVFDLGTGTGVLAAVLVRRGASRVVATDISPRAVASARANTTRLGLEESVEVVETDLFPPGRADLVICNPPWLPGDPTSLLEVGIYDPGSGMLRRFLDGLASHLEPEGEGWLVLSDLAEHLGLRTREELLGLIAAAGLRVVERHETAPRHPRATDATDALHAARRSEVTSLWRLAALTR